MGAGGRHEDSSATAMGILRYASNPSGTGVGSVGAHISSTAPHVGSGPCVEDEGQWAGASGWWSRWSCSRKGSLGSSLKGLTVSYLNMRSCGSRCQVSMVVDQGLRLLRGLGLGGVGGGNSWPAGRGGNSWLAACSSIGALPRVTIVDCMAAAFAEGAHHRGGRGPLPPEGLLGGRWRSRARLRPNCLSSCASLSSQDWLKASWAV